MTIASRRVGIDVSKAWLDVFDASAGRAQRLANRPTDIALYLATLPNTTIVVFEATAPYDAKLRRALGAAGLVSVRANPGRVRNYARASGFLAKTDTIDARMLATLPDTITTVSEQAFDEEREALAALHRRRDQLVGMRAVERGRIADEPEPRAKKSLARHIVWLDGEIGKIEAAIKAALAAPAFAPRVAPIRSIKGVGEVTATTLVALLPELGTLSAKAIAARAGLAPINRDGGTMRGERHIGGGRRRVRQALYMAALGASRCIHRYKAHDLAIKERRRHAKIAVVAVARKLLVTLAAMVKSGEPFRA
jgi:transposase